jgi:hypothetical protein
MPLHCKILKPDAPELDALLVSDGKSHAFKKGRGGMLASADKVTTGSKSSSWYRRAIATAINKPRLNSIAAVGG